MFNKLLIVLVVLSLNSSASLTSSTGSILSGTNISDITASIVAVVGILAPTLYAFLGAIIAVGIMVALMSITGVLPNFVKSISRKLERI